MLQYFIKRFLVLIPKLLLITLIIFFAMELMPGDILTRTMDPETISGLNEAQLEQLREAMGLNDPAFVRYFRWMGGLFSGDFGYSLNSGTAVAELLAQRLPATLYLTAFALLISTVIGIGLGFLSAIRKNTPVDYTCSVVGMVGISVPEFFFGMLFILVFAVQLAWLPSGGRVDGEDLSLWGYIKHMILPASTMSIALVATLMRYTRSSMLDVMGKDYIKTARAKGLKDGKVYVKHCFRNGCAPVIPLLIGRLGILISGTTIIETVFNYAGMGSLFVATLVSKDTPVVMTILMLTSLTVLVTTFLADVVLAMLDPRVRFGEE